MWFDPGEIGHFPQAPLATLATLRLCNSKTSTQGAEVAEVAEVATPHYRWLLHFADREPLTVAFSPAANHAEALAGYPSALAAEPIEPGRRQPDTLLAAEEETAIQTWLASIGENDTSMIVEVIERCRHDDGARAYYLGRAKAIADDDRRCCSQCGNLRGGVCVVARPGGRVSAIVGYRPASPDMPQRCAGYAPNANDTNQRTGREHWPGLIQKGGE